MLLIFDTDLSDKRQATQKVLHGMTIFGSNLEEYLHLIVPVIVKLFEKLDVPVSVRKYAIQVIAILSRKIGLADQASKIIHPLVRVLNSSVLELRNPAMDTLSAMLYQLGYDFIIFIPMINKVWVYII